MEAPTWSGLTLRCTLRHLICSSGESFSLVIAGHRNLTSRGWRMAEMIGEDMDAGWG